MNKSITTLVLATLFWLPQIASASALTQGQIDSILSLLAAFNVDSATITIVRDELKPDSIHSFQFVPVMQSATTTTTETHQATPQGVLAVPTPVPVPVVVTPTQTIALKNPSACAEDLKSNYDLATLIAQTFPDPTWKPEEPRFGGIKMAVFVSPKPASVIVDVTPTGLEPTSSDYPYHKDITGWYNPASKSCGERYLYTLVVNQKGTYTVTVTTPETSKATTIQVN